jgi:murein DD-endopeptidase MepM/ murein hydrolase activator NlpD
MNALLFLAGGGIAAYFVVRHQLDKAKREIDKVAKDLLPALRTFRPPATTTTPATPSSVPSQSPPRDGAVPYALQPRPITGRHNWPVPQWQGRAPVISSGYSSQHLGVDIMFARLPSDPFAQDSPNGTKSYVMPDGWVALAASDGVLWSAHKTPRGYAVVIDHGHEATFYTHLETLFVPERLPQPHGPADQRIYIKAGQPLGVIGADPLDPEHIKHLHFEIWSRNDRSLLWTGGAGNAMNPEQRLRNWQQLAPFDIAPFFANLPRNAARPDLVPVRAHHRAYPGERQR